MSKWAIRFYYDHREHKGKSMKNIKSVVCVVAVVSVLAACKQNPLPEGGIVQLVPAPFRSVGPVFSLVTPPFFEFQEGVETTHQLDVAAADGKTLVLESRGLPAGAVFDAKSKRLTWKPGFDVANKGNLPQPKQFEMHFVLRNTSNAVEAIDKTVYLIVKDSPQTIQLSATNSYPQLKEGLLFSFNASIKSDDYPNGPFVLKTAGDLSGIQVTPLDANKTTFKIQFQPRASMVKSNTGSVTKKVQLIAVAPDGREETLDQNWTIGNVVFPPIVSAPTQLTANEVAAWTVTAEDPNAEGKPTIHSPIVPFGKLVAQEINFPGAVGQNPVRSVSFFWSQVPFEQMDKSHSLDYEVCSGNMSGSTKCSKHVVTVKVSAEASNPPAIDRKEWPLGQTKYVLEGTTAAFPLIVTDANGSKEAPIVTVSASTKDSITYSKGMLTIQAKTPKLVQVNVTATTSYGARQVESFLLEVLPKHWGDTLVIGDYKKDPEIASIFKFSDQVQFLNPLLQGADERTLAFRKRMIVSTAALSDPEQLPGIEYLASKIPNVLIMSPKVTELKGALRQEFNSLQVETPSRLIYATKPPMLSNVNLKFLSSGMSGVITAPPSMVKLKGALTDESHAPGIVQASASFWGSSSCKNIFAYNDATTSTQWPAVVECKRANGGLLLISGLEWGDLSYSAPNDENWITSWFKNWGKK